MNVYVITSDPETIEDNQINKSLIEAGHKPEFIYLTDISLLLDNAGVIVDRISNIESGIVILRGVRNNVREVILVVKNLKRKGVKIFDNGLLNHQYSKDKLADLIKLANKGIKIPKTYYSSKHRDILKAATSIGYPVILKHRRSAQGSKIFKLENKKELIDMVDSFDQKDVLLGNFLLQECIPYMLDIRCLVVGSNIFTMKRIPKKGDFRANFSLGGTVEPYDLDEAGKVLAKKALDAVGLSVGGVDILITKNDEMYILEVNHTPGFTGIEKATGVNIAEIYVKHALANAKSML